jgi:hypothetical protein
VKEYDEKSLSDENDNQLAKLDIKHLRTLMVFGRRSKTQAEAGV